jgi:hypothetical protein
MSQFSWRPSFGDPSLEGWAIVFLYVLAVLGCWAAAHKLKRGTERNAEQWAWLAILLLMLALGINKQLDVQTALTELGRLTAQWQGWYEKRHIVQELFVLAVAIVCATAVVVLLYWTRRASTASAVAMVGASLLLAFVVVRGISFHHIDHFLGARIGGFKRHWILEVSGVFIVLGASLWRFVQLEYGSRS